MRAVGGPSNGDQKLATASNVPFMHQAGTSFNNASMQSQGMNMQSQGMNNMQSQQMNSMSFAHPQLFQQQQTSGAQMNSRSQSGPESSMKPAPGMNVSGLAGSKQFLPPSAPVSSLLPQIPTQNNNAHANSNLQSQIAALLSNGGMNGNNNNGQFAVQNPQATGNAASGGMPMQNWNMNQLGRSYLMSQQSAPQTSSLPSTVSLEQHVKLLDQYKQPVPQTVALLLADARRKKEKKEAKRVANRKSACTSRARKKALVQEMTETNARLKRQALILALLPDLVIVIDVEGEITFCSAQVERVLRHKNEELVGAKLTDLLIPSSRDALQKLVNELVESEKAAAADVEENRAKRPRDEDNNGNESGGGDTATSAAAVVSEPSSFPLSVVKVAAVASDENDTSDASASNGLAKERSSLTNSAASLPRSPGASSASVGNSGSDDGDKKKAASRKGMPSSDGSSVSTDAKKLQKANANLERNVRWHNKKMKANKRNGYMDDVLGADVTANNASARLSSLQHLPEAASEEDSGYRESNDSREETSSSSDSSTSNGKRSFHGQSGTYNIHLQLC
jgi:PAS domain S-box-containing protein